MAGCFLQQLLKNHAKGSQAILAEKRVAVHGGVPKFNIRQIIKVCQIEKSPRVMATTDAKIINRERPAKDGALFSTEPDTGRYWPAKAAGRTL
jgi:hypothetical protein